MFFDGEALFHRLHLDLASNMVTGLSRALAKYLECTLCSDQYQALCLYKEARVGRRHAICILMHK